MANLIVTDEKGNKVSVLVPVKQYEKMVKALEDAADERAYERAKRGSQNFIPIKEAIKLRKQKLKEQNGKV